MPIDTPQAFPLLPRTISLLVSGHRKERLEAGGRNPGPALKRLDAVLGAFAELHRSDLGLDDLFPASLYAAESTTIRVLTGQASGVDQHAIKTANALRLPVDVIVPDHLGAARDKADRSVAFGCTEEDAARDDDAVYEMRDELALAYADMLIAVWDGERPQGKAGGVVRLVERAVKGGMPVLWIDMHGALHTIAGDRVTEYCIYQFSRPIPPEGLLCSLFEKRGPHDDVLIDTLRGRLNPLDEKYVKPSKATEVLKSYASERHPPSWIERRVGWFDELMRGVLMFNPRGIANGISRAIRGAAASHASDEADAVASTEHLRMRYRWSDERANIASRRHASSIWLLYMLSSAAVFASVAGIVSSDAGWSLLSRRSDIEWDAWWSAAEGVFVVIILVSFWRAHRADWHRFWLGHRFIAEQIRYLGILAPFLGIPPPFNEPLFVLTKGHLRLRNAELWLLQRSASAGGLPSRYCSYDLEAESLVRLATPLEESVKQQLGFHDKKCGSMRGLRERMEHLAIRIFEVAAFITAVHVLILVARICGIEAPFPHVPRILEKLEHLLPLVSAATPALGAALHGVMTKLEYGRVAQQSKKAHARLVTYLQAVQDALKTPQANGWRAAANLRFDALNVVNLLAGENVQWRDLIHYQKTEIP
ncbi:DUF4231 domain-containing protein [Caballeronia sp. Lep1P3]|uniref:DUF4231 domain-containing protein n=1 Tax=Caballeronia sp. Lep1P3 TaxID=2878150 RepID=UPI001FD3139A|nr:DUF4231 domain-containing protein [Caballeronia sp. Lep1P3]